MLCFQKLRSFIAQVCIQLRTHLRWWRTHKQQSTGASPQWMMGSQCCDELLPKQHALTTDHLCVWCTYLTSLQNVDTKLTTLSAFTSSASMPLRGTQRPLQLGPSVSSFANHRIIASAHSLTVLVTKFESLVFIMEIPLRNGHTSTRAYTDSC